MAHLGTLGQYRFKDKVDDVRGSEVYGRNNEKLGTVDDVIFDHDTCQIHHIVVNSEGWLGNRKFTIPADRIFIRDQGDLQTDFSRDQVRQRFPEYEDNVHQDPDRWNQYEIRHREAYSEAGGVLHKEGSPNIITPDPDEMPAASGDIQGDFTPDRMAGKFPDTEPGSGKIRMRPSGTTARAEDTSIPGAAQNSETARWEEPDTAIDPDVSGSAVNPDNSEERRRFIIARDTGCNISEVDPGDDTAEFDATEEDLHRPYPVQEGRNERFRAFEENLRRNRVDITASCRSCAPGKDRAA